MKEDDEDEEVKDKVVPEVTEAVVPSLAEVPRVLFRTRVFGAGVNTDMRATTSTKASIDGMLAEIGCAACIVVL